MPTELSTLVTHIRGLLDRLVASRDLDNDEQEVVGDEVKAEVRALPREGILEALDKAIGSSRKRREESIYILSELADVPEVVDRIGRGVAIQIRRLERGLYTQSSRRGSSNLHLS